jgi:transcriptional regulator with XRE-family HTH domain
MRSHWLSVLSLLFLLLGAAAAPGFAAPAPEDGESHAEIALTELAKRLNLTPEQQARIEPALQERNSRLRTVAGRLSPNASRRERLRAAREMRDIQQEFVAKVTPVLTSEQKSEWERMRSEMRDKARERARSQRQ